MDFSYDPSKPKAVDPQSRRTNMTYDAGPKAAPPLAAAEGLVNGTRDPGPLPDEPVVVTGPETD